MSSSPRTSNFLNDDKTVCSSANGELYRFQSQSETFKLLFANVQANIIEDNDTDKYTSKVEFYQTNGDLLLSQPITNAFSIQYNKANHSMTFSIENTQKKRVDILSFKFYDAKEEQHFKMKFAIKLFEFNRKQNFGEATNEQNIAEDDAQWIGNSFEICKDNDDEYDQVENDLMVLDEEPNVIINTSDMDMEIEDTNDNNNNNNNNNNDNNNKKKKNDYHNEEDTKLNQHDLQHEQLKRLSKLPLKNNENEDLKCLPSLSNKNDDDNNIENQNKDILGSKCYNRTFVVRHMNDGNASTLGYFKHNDDNDLEYEGKLEITDMKNKSISPYQTLQFQQDRKLLLLSKQHPEYVSVMNLDRGKVVEEWKIQDEDCGGVTNIAPMNKYDDMTNNNLFYGLNNNSMFTIDGRIPTESKIVTSMAQFYKSKVHLSCMATTGQGFIATGSKTGQIRLHDQINMRAKTLLPGLGQHIKYIETTQDGKWILCTCQEYIMVISTTMENSEYTGFERRMGKQKNRPYVLRLKNQDIIKYNLTNIDFTPAHFNIGLDTEEHWIVTSTGPFIIKWNFRRLKKNGIVNDYQIRRGKNNVVRNLFRYNVENDVLVSEADSVYVQHSHKESEQNKQQ